MRGVQRKATKLIRPTGMQSASYNDTVERLGLMRINTRTLRSDLVETLKTINGNYSMRSEFLFEFDDVNIR